jgi:hypothetical protein
LSIVLIHINRESFLAKREQNYGFITSFHEKERGQRDAKAFLKSAAHRKSDVATYSEG